MAAFSFLCNAPASFTINNLSGSGIGFYSSTFGGSVAVSAYNDTTYVTNSTGTVQSVQTNNVKYLNTASGILNSASSGVHLLAIPNYLTTLNIHFNHTSAVKTQNTKLYIYDRSSINNPPSGVICKVAEVIHYNTVQGGLTGSGSSLWQSPVGSSFMSLAAAPGTSGTSVNGPETTSFDHDWYVCLSASPSSVGSKTQFGLYVETEYL